jgi:hypothetical protein
LRFAHVASPHAKQCAELDAHNSKMAHPQVVNTAFA